jgi:hypothetical protein
MGSLTSPQSARHQVSGTCQADLPAWRPTPLPRDNHRPVELPSCVTPPACLLPVRFPPSACPSRRTARIRRSASPASAWAEPRGYGNINPLSIDYACRPRLRPRLTLGGLACPRNPWSSGGGVSHASFATHACILAPAASTAGSPRCFPGRATLPYPPAHLDPRHSGSSGTDRIRTPKDPSRDHAAAALADKGRASRADATASAVCLSPATLSARNHLTSELLRTLSRVAASEPTSWLSAQLHILSHLAHA